MNDIFDYDFEETDPFDRWEQIENENRANEYFKDKPMTDKDIENYIRSVDGVL